MCPFHYITLFSVHQIWEDGIVAKRGITEEFKTKDQIAWVSAMEQIKHTAEEFVFEYIVYAGGTSK